MRHSVSATGSEYAALHGKTALVTGVTGYIGGQLVEPLLAAGARVRVLSRDERRIADEPWRDRVEAVIGDATSPSDLDRALRDVDVAYYLLHSMDGGGDLGSRDRAMAEQFAASCAAQSVGRIVYLGALHPDGELSEHLASRVEVGEVLLDGEVPAIVLQAAVVIGAGSASFQMLRYLTLRLPAMVTPQWLRNKIQPIAIDDVVGYLLAAGAAGETRLNRAFDIGGPEVVTYEQLIQRFARIAGIPRRLIVTVPLLSPALSSYWVGFVTPVDASIARPLVGSLIHEVIVRDQDARTELAPQLRLTDLDDALRAAESASPPESTIRSLVVVGSGLALGGLAAAGCVVRWITSGRRR